MPQPQDGLRAITARRRVGVRLWLGLAFAGVGVITALSVYLFVSDRTGKAISERETAIAVGRTQRLGQRLGVGFPNTTAKRVRESDGDSFKAWAFDRRGQLLTPEIAGAPRTGGVSLATVPSQQLAIETALKGETYRQSFPDGQTITAAPIHVTIPATGHGPARLEQRTAGAVLSRATRPASLDQSLAALRRDRLATVAVAIAVALLIGFLVATTITARIKRLAESAGRIAEGRLDIPLVPRGHDEIGDLGRAFERMRVALRGTFNALSSERDRLSAIFDALDEAVLVVSSESGEVRFSNSAAGALVEADGLAADQLRPWLQRASERGTVTQDGLRIGDRVYAVAARELPAEAAVLAVVRDRTEELRREIAEREFVSNAAHELRNPIAGISGAVEVLRGGAKDDPEARDHFLERLQLDAERVSRLTQSLLTLARMEAIGEGEAEVVGVTKAAEEAADAVQPADGIEFHVDTEPDLAARADPVLLRQVLIGLLTNAFKNTPAPGAVTLRARRDGADDVVIEVADTGPGIPPQEVDRVFERFYRGSGQLEREGFGLGLSIAKRMVDVMGGSIAVESVPGAGSTFYVRLPLARTSPAPVA
jgi:two-component system phosphate regulon sensor histidine kinase PhoR